jgi:hypothetical protein
MLRDSWAGPATVQGAAGFAVEQVTRVRDDPAGRMALLARTYQRPLARSRRHQPFRRAAVSFMRWQAQRGVLRPTDGDRPGSRWWRAVNERLLLDGCEAMARAGGLSGEPSSPTIAQWSSFVAEPTPRSWYRAHNLTIVSAYLEHRDLAEHESAGERFFINVALVRVLYAHALVAAPRLSLGRFAALGRVLGDPRLGMAGAFLSLRRVLPDVYPLDRPIETYLPLENRVGRMLDYGMIVPRLQDLYEWSAQELALPRLCELIRDGSPTYALSQGDQQAWQQARESLGMRALRAATSAR